mgnify:FL=1
MRRLFTPVLALSIIAAPLTLHAAHSKEVEARFESTYGVAVRGVKGTRSSADDAKLAAILLADAQKLSGDDDFAVKLYEQTWELGKLHTTGFRPAADALQELSKLEPSRPIEMEENLVWL